MPLVTMLITSILLAGTVQIGPSRTYKTIQEGVDAAVDGDVVEIDAGDYPGTAVKIATSNLTLKGVGGRPHLTYSGNNPNDKGILVVEDATVHDLVLENLEISGATGASGNAASVRFQGKNLTVRDCYLHHSQNGILEGNGAVTGSVVLVEQSELAFNGIPDSGTEHNMYISASVQTFTLRFSYSHHAKEGHLVKSRAQETYILANRLMDELPVLDGGSTDQSSALIDLPQGGRAFVVGNLLHKGSNTQNKNAAIWYGGENGDNAPHELYVVNNTHVSDTGFATTAMILAKRGAVIFAANNLVMGDGVTILDFQPLDSAADRIFTIANNLVDDALDKLTLFSGSVIATADVTYTASSNQTIADAKLVNRASFDWHLLADSPAIDKGIDPGTSLGFDLTPAFQYVHPVTSEARPEVGPLDAGAYEYGTATPTTSQPPSSNPDGGTITGPPNPNTPPPPPPPAADKTDQSLANGASILGSCAGVGAEWSVVLLVLLVRLVLARRRSSKT
jgi:hypothetical protein